jgi:hypothetical protein
VSEKDEKLVNEVGTGKKEADSPNGNPTVSPPATETIGTANPTQPKMMDHSYRHRKKSPKSRTLREKINYL